jgi:hypothetical protein
MSRLDDIQDLKTELKDSVDVSDDERLRIVANAWIVRVAFIVAAVIAFPMAFLVAGALMTWIDGGRGVAVVCALIGALTSAAGPALIRHAGLGFERRYLQRVFKRSATRMMARLGSFGGQSSIAIPTMHVDTNER